MEKQVIEEQRLLIKDIIGCSMADDDTKGDKVFETIIERLDSGVMNVILDFKGIELVNTAFLNNAIGKLFNTSIVRDKRKHVTVTGMDNTMIELLQETIRVARQTYMYQ